MDCVTDVASLARMPNYGFRLRARERQKHRDGKEHGSEQIITGMPPHEAPRPGGNRFLSEYHHVFGCLENNIGGIFGKIDAICPDDAGECSLINDGERDKVACNSKFGVSDFEGFSG